MSNNVDTNLSSTIATSLLLDASAPDSPDVYLAAYNKLLAEAKAIPEEEYIHQSFDVVTGVGLTIGKMPKLMSLYERMKTLPKSEWRIEDIDAYLERTRALRQAEADVLVAVAPIPPVTELLAASQDDEAKLFSQVHVLVTHDVVAGAPIEALRQNGGHRNVATNNLALISYIRQNRDRAGTLVFLTEAQLAEMAGRSAKLDDAISERESQPRRIAEAQRIRRAYFTMFMRSYYTSERAVLFLEPDHIEDFLPPLFDRGPRKASAKPANPTPAAVTKSSESGVVPAIDADAPSGEPGMPGNNPFMTIPKK